MGKDKEGWIKILPVSKAKGASSISKHPTLKKRKKMCRVIPKEQASYPTVNTELSLSTK